MIEENICKNTFDNFNEILKEFHAFSNFRKLVTFFLSGAIEISIQIE